MAAKKVSLHAKVSAAKKRSRARDERALKTGAISAQALSKRNFFFEGLDFSKARIIRSKSARKT